MAEPTTGTDPAGQAKTTPLETDAPPDMVPLPATGPLSLAAWRKRVKAAQDKLQPVVVQGKANIQRYRVAAAKKQDDVVVPLDFSYVEQKKAALYFQTPEVQLTPLQPELQTAVPVFQAVVNDMLGPNEINAKRLADECLFDVLEVGIAPSKIGYENTVNGTKPVLVPGPPDPRTGQPSQVPATDPMTGELQTVPNIIAERYYWRRISPARVLIPHDFHGSDFDEADWLGFEYFEDIPEGEQGTGGSLEAEHSLSTEAQLEKHATPPRRRCVEIWYRAARLDTTTPGLHPELYRQLVFKDGIDDPTVHRDSPYQHWTGGDYVGMCGNPIHILTLRYVSDSAYPPADATISRQPIDEVSAGRTQMVKQRKRSIPMRGVDKARVTPEEIEKITRGEWQEVVPTDGPPNEILAEIARAQYPRENFEFDRIAKEDAASSWALQIRGANEDAGRTATEASYKQQTTETRLDYEQNKVAEWFAKGAAKAASLKQLFADQTSYVRVVGQGGAQSLQAWDRTHIQGKYAFSVKADTLRRKDPAAEQKKWIDLYNLAAKDPQMNGAEMRAGLIRSYGADPSKMIVPPPPEKPEPLNVTWSIKIDDFVGPGAEIAALLAQHAGVPIPPDVLQRARAGGLVMQLAQQQAAQTPPEEHGGPAEAMEPISKHSATLTGRRPGPGPM